MSISIISYMFWCMPLGKHVCICVFHLWEDSMVMVWYELMLELVIISMGNLLCIILCATVCICKVDIIIILLPLSFSIYRQECLEVGRLPNLLKITQQKSELECNPALASESTPLTTILNVKYKISNTSMLLYIETWSVLIPLPEKETHYFCQFLIF